MAFTITPEYAHSVNLQKLTINGSTYWLKDADLRTIVEGFGDAVYKNVDTTFSAEGVNLATEAATAAYIADQIKGMEGVLRFKGVLTRTEGQTYREAIDAWYTAKSEVPRAGDVVVFKADAKEFICTGNSAQTIAGAEWEEIGDQAIYLTKTEAASTYTPLTRKIAGIDLADDITVAELSGSDALNLKALSHKDSASGTVEVLDTIDNISVGKAGEYNVTGQDTIDVPVTYNALDVTPAGTIDVTAGTAAAATYQKATSATISSSDVGSGETANYTPAGTVSLPSLTASVTLSGTDVATVTDIGTGYTITDGSVTKAEDTTAKFAKKALKYTVVAADQELQLDYVANTDTDFYTDAVTAAGAITYTKQTLSGSLPTFGTQEVALKTGVTASAAYSGDATFTGKGTKLANSIGYETANATVTQPTFTADFTGTSKSVTPAVATTSPAAVAGGKVTVATQDTAITANKKTVTVTVS